MQQSNRLTVLTVQELGCSRLPLSVQEVGRSLRCHLHKNGLCNIATDSANLTVMAPASRQTKPSFNANTGTGTITDITVDYAGTATVPASTGLTAPGVKTFSKWNTAAAGTEQIMPLEIQSPFMHLKCFMQFGNNKNKEEGLAPSFYVRKSVAVQLGKRTTRRKYYDIPFNDEYMN